MRSLVLAVAGVALSVLTACTSGDTSVEIVTKAPVASVTIDLAAGASLIAGQSQRVSATTKDANGVVLSGRIVTWQSTSPQVASVDASGLISALAPGAAMITATSEGVSGQGTLNVMAAPAVPVASVSVSPSTSTLQVGSTLPLVAVTRDAASNVLTGRAIGWSSDNAAIATVSAAGLVTGVSAGSATITAASEGKSATASITVSTIPVALVSVAPATSSVPIGSTVQLSAATRDANNNVLTGRTVTWSSGSTGVATVSSTGLVTGVSAGTATITAASEGKSATASITVTTAAVGSVSVSPATSSVQVGSTVQLSATTRDANNNVLTGRTVTWSSGSTGVATVSSTGLVTGVAVGSATITASSEGKSAIASVTVTYTTSAAASLSISPSQTNLQTGGKAQLGAITRDAGGAIITGQPITWTTSNAAVVSVSSTGLISGVAVGTGTITATSGQASGTTSVSVVPPVTGTGAPEPGGSDVILWQDNFDRTTLSSMVSPYATRGVMDVVQDGRSGQAIRFTYSGGSYDNLIEKGFTTTTDIYFRFWWRSSPGADPSCGGLNDNGFKWFMAWRPGSDPRYTLSATNADGTPYQGRPNAGMEFTSHDNSSTAEPGQFLSNINHSIRFSTTNEGNWHKYTLHIVTGTGGYEQIWVDDVLLLDNSGYGYDHVATGISFIQFPGTMVRWFDGCDWSMDVDDLVIWHK